MKQQQLLIEISELLARFKAQVNILNAGSLFDVNVISEDFLIPLLNEIYDYELVNANQNIKNYPGIDLIDEKNKIGFQITSTNSFQKIKSTLDKIIKHKIYTKVNECFILIISEKPTNYNQDTVETTVQGKLKFSKKNIIDLGDLFSKIKTLNLTKLQKISEYLKSQYTDSNKTNKILDSNFQTIITELKKYIDMETLAIRIESAHKAKISWHEKKSFLESNLPALSDLNQKYSVNKSIQECEEKIKNYEEEIISILTKISI